MNSLLAIDPASPEDIDQVVDLWTQCGLVVLYNPPDQDFLFAQGKPASDVLVGRLDGRVVATAMAGHDGHRGWLYYVAVDPEHQGSGYGAAIVEAAENWLRERGVRKVQLLVRSTNSPVLSFYDRIGYERSDVTVMQRWLEPGH